MPQLRRVPSFPPPQRSPALATASCERSRPPHHTAPYSRTPHPARQTRERKISRSHERAGGSMSIAGCCRTTAPHRDARAGGGCAWARGEDARGPRKNGRAQGGGKAQEQKKEEGGEEGKQRKEEGLHTSRLRARRRRAARIVIPARVLHNTRLVSTPAPASSSFTPLTPLTPLTTVPGHVPSTDPRAGKHDAATHISLPAPAQRARKRHASQDRRRRRTHSNLSELRVCVCAAPTTRRKIVVTGRNTPASASPPGERAPHPHAASARALKPETTRNRTRPRYSACMPLMLRPLALGASRKSVRGDGRSTCGRGRKTTKKEGRGREWDGGGTKDEGGMRWT
ncbi:hypothetical protein DFH09DRAFT_1300372 [Mycena vulgaris]|nr:hypothetical protein DFH09DRAFT_1300372 [Mycena vulgaris]